jgi:hypothetical protein
MYHAIILISETVILIKEIVKFFMCVLKMYADDIPIFSLM